MSDSAAPVYLRPALSPTAAMHLLVRDIDSLGAPPAQLLVALALAHETLAAEAVT